MTLIRFVFAMLLSISVVAVAMNLVYLTALDLGALTRAHPSLSLIWFGLLMVITAIIVMAAGYACIYLWLKLKKYDDPK
jgi:hypothetical protein